MYTRIKHLPMYVCRLPILSQDLRRHSRRSARRFTQRVLFSAADPAPIGLFMFGLASALSAVRFGQSVQSLLLEYHESARNGGPAHWSSRGVCAA